MASYYKRKKQEGATRYVTRVLWLYHATLPDLLSSIREQGLRPLRDVASRLARDAAERGAADAGTEVDPGFVHLYGAEGPLRLALLTWEAVVLRMRTSAMDPALLTRDPKAALDLLRSDDPERAPLRQEIIGRLNIPGDVALDIQRRLAVHDAAGALELFAPYVDAVNERVWAAAPFGGFYRYAGIIPAADLQVLVEFPEELASVRSIGQAVATGLRLDSRRWTALTGADLSAVARGLGRTEFPADPT